MINEMAVPRIDKSQWGAGPWQHEPDRIEWEYKGLPCLIVRGPVGALCGYAAVLPGHPWHGAAYGDCVVGCKEVPRMPLQAFNGIPVPESMQKRHMAHKNFACREDYKPNHTPESIVDVHGGLTYSGFCSGTICHVPKPGQPDNVYWFGFDCAHAGDVCPKFEEIGKQIGHRIDSMLGGQYRDVAYVKAQVERLADQLLDLK